MKPQVNPAEEPKLKAVATDEVAVLQPYAHELVRLARDVTQQIKSGEVSPRCLSGLMALVPLVTFLQKATFSILRDSSMASDGETELGIDDDHNEEESGTLPGYL